MMAPPSHGQSWCFPWRSIMRLGLPSFMDVPMQGGAAISTGGRWSPWGRWDSSDTTWHGGPNPWHSQQTLRWKTFKGPLKKVKKSFKTSKDNSVLFLDSKNLMSFWFKESELVFLLTKKQFSRLPAEGSNINSFITWWITSQMLQNRKRAYHSPCTLYYNTPRFQYIFSRIKRVITGCMSPTVDNCHDSHRVIMTSHVVYYHICAFLHYNF